MKEIFLFGWYLRGWGYNLMSQTRMEAWGKSNLHAHLGPSRKWAVSSVLTVRNPNSSGHSGGVPLSPQRLRLSESSSQSCLLIPPLARSPIPSVWASKAQSQDIYKLAHSRGGERLCL